MAFNWQEKIKFLKDRPSYNNASPQSYLDDPFYNGYDTRRYGVEIVKKENTNWTASVYKLSPDENKSGHFIYIEILCKQNERQRFRPVHWGWEGMSQSEINQTSAIFPDKPLNEIYALHILPGQRIWLEVGGGDRVKNLNAMIDPDHAASDGSNGNTRGHHSYLVLFQEVDHAAPPKPDPKPEPDPKETIGNITVTISKAEVVSMQPDAQGNITFIVNIYR